MGLWCVVIFQHLFSWIAVSNDLAIVIVWMSYPSTEANARRRGHCFHDRHLEYNVHCVQAFSLNELIVNVVNIFADETNHDLWQSS